MGFLDFVGEIVGKAAAKAQEIQCYKNEYECLSDDDLIKEYNSLEGKFGQEERVRFSAVKMVLSDRGYLKS